MGRFSGSKNPTAMMKNFCCYCKTLKIKVKHLLDDLFLSPVANMNFFYVRIYIFIVLFINLHNSVQLSLSLDSNQRGFLPLCRPPFFRFCMGGLLNLTLSIWIRMIFGLHIFCRIFSYVNLLYFVSFSYFCCCCVFVWLRAENKFINMIQTWTRCRF